jgi:hypothetical protein
MKRVICALAAVVWLQAAWAAGPLVFQSDFGTRDAAVAAMKGVAVGVSQDLRIFDLTHEIPAYSIWEASIRLAQAAEYWPPGTVFVSVVDPGVGTERKSIVMRSRSGHFFVTPDNGTLTFIAEELGIDEVREIDEAVNRLANSGESYTFHGRDVYAYTGARLAAGVIDFEEVGKKLPARVVSIPYQQPIFEDGTLKGNVPVLDIQYGNVWTNIDRETFAKLGIKPGGTVEVSIRNGNEARYEGRVPYHPTFGYVEVGEPLLYLNSLNNVSLAINQGNFAEKHNIGSGARWNIEIRK